MSYKYLNPRTEKTLQLKDHNDMQAELLLENKKTDILFAVSDYSKTFKVLKWHFPQYGGDKDEGIEIVQECPISLIQELITPPIPMELSKEDIEEGIYYLSQLFK